MQKIYPIGNRGAVMNKKKVDVVSYWIWWTLAIMAVFWIVLVHNMRMSHLVMLPVFAVYMLLNVIIFNSYYLGLVGTYYLYRGNSKKAFTVYEKAIKKKTRNVHALYHWALKLLQDGKGEEALGFLKKAEYYNTKVVMHKNIVLAMGSCYWIMGNIDKAIDVIESLMAEFEYVNASVLTTVGYLYFLKEDLEKAEQYSSKALEDNPSHSAAWDNMGQIYYSKGEYNKAKEYFTKALDYKSSMVDSLFYMGKIAELENDVQLAKSCFEKAAECNITSLNTVTRRQVDDALAKYNKA